MLFPDNPRASTEVKLNKIKEHKPARNHNTKYLIIHNLKSRFGGLVLHWPGNRPGLFLPGLDEGDNHCLTVNAHNSQAKQHEVITKQKPHYYTQQ